MSRRRPIPREPIDIGSVVGTDVTGSPVVYTDELGEAAVRYNLATCPGPDVGLETPEAIRLRCQAFFRQIDRELAPDEALTALGTLIDAHQARNGPINRGPLLGVPAANPAAGAAERLFPGIEAVGVAPPAANPAAEASEEVADRAGVPPLSDQAVARLDDAAMAGQQMEYLRGVMNRTNARLGEIQREILTLTALGGELALQRCRHLEEEQQLIREFAVLQQQMTDVNLHMQAQHRRRPGSRAERDEIQGRIGSLFEDRIDLQRRIDQRLERLTYLSHFSPLGGSLRWDSANPPQGNTPRTGREFESADSEYVLSEEERVELYDEGQGRAFPFDPTGPDTVFVTAGDLDGLLAAADLNLPAGERDEVKSALAETIGVLSRARPTAPAAIDATAVTGRVRREAWVRWLPVKEVCDALLSPERSGRHTWVTQYNTRMSQRHYDAAGMIACRLKAAALIGILARPYREEGTVQYRPEEVFLDLRAEQSRGDWPDADELARLCDALHRAMRDTPDALCFPGGGVCNVGLHGQSQPEVYRKIRKEPS